jgi:Rrf2 family iron-sulfur cluster assembly transcriptional regulator
MRLTTRTRYALRALIELSQLPRGEVLSARVIAKRQHVHLGYLEQILHRLRRAGLIIGRKGPGGGFLLAREPKNIRLRDILDAAGETIAPVHCLLGKTDTHCPRVAVCPMKSCWNELKIRIDVFFDHYTLRDILCGMRQGRSRKEK